MQRSGNDRVAGAGGLLLGKVAIVTGASRGIGRAIARLLASDGAQVAGFSRDLAQLERTQELIAADDGTFLPWLVDVTNAEAVRKAMREVADNSGGIDILVNNAAVCLRGALTELTTADYDSMIVSNVNSIVYCCHSAWEPMRTRGGGVIINISSLSASVSSPGFAVYAATKGFVNAFTAALAGEGRKAGIRVYAVAPGYVRTELLERVSPEVPAEKALEPEDVAIAVRAFFDLAHLYSSGEVRYLRR